jgi:uncharacterized membrane protein (UPF0182 family)
VVRVGTPMQRRWPLVVIGAVVIAAIIFTILAQFYVDLLWYREVGFSAVFWRILRTKSVLGLFGSLFFFVLLYVNLLIARRLSPRTVVIAPDQESVERLRQNIEPYLWWLMPVGAVVLALFVGATFARQWQTFLLWRNSSGLTFGHAEPQFHRDAAFYVFDLPVLRFLQGELYSSLAFVTLITAGAHVLWGGIRPQAPALADKVVPAVRAHLSVLLGAIMLAKAWGYYLGRFSLLTSKRGVVEGASYTDVKAQLPALNFLVIAAVICAILFLANIRLRNWALPVIAVVILAGVSVLLGTAYPAIVQQFSVKPQEQQREAPYIGYNIAGTRAAFGLDKIQTTPRPVTGTLTPQAEVENQATISNVRLWRPEILKENFQSLQRIKQYYDFSDVDVDRYQVQGQERVLMVSAREVSQSQILQGGVTWQNTHLVYTHGFGVVASQVNTVSPEGQPDFVLQDIPPTSPIGDESLVPTQPRIYYGELSDVPFVVVGTKTRELDYEGATSPEQYHGKGGIPLGNIFQRALFAWRFHDINLLISGQITSDSRILIRRDLLSRVKTPAPFLTFDHDPYLAIVSGRPTWIWDAYTTSDQYPYSQAVNMSDVTGSGPTVNYLRNSIKVAVDAYDGTITYYVVDPQDPIAAAWSRAFPEMFTTTTPPSELQKHFRYPEDLFTVQADQFANYHVTDPSVFYRKTDRWQIPQDPTFCANNPKAPECSQSIGSVRPLHPSYQLMRLPGETDEGFVLALPFVPQQRPNMVGYMAAKSDPGSYGQIVSYAFPSGGNILGPSQVFSAINQDRTFSQERTLLGQTGSAVLFGDFLAIPINDAFMYVEPVYVRSNGQQAIPELKRVVVVDGQGNVSVASTLTDALKLAVGSTGNAGGNTGPPSGTPTQQIQALLQQALEHFQKANEALKAGDLATYQRELQQAQDLVSQASALASKEPTGETGTSPSISPSPSTTASP